MGGKLYLTGGYGNDGPDRRAVESAGAAYRQHAAAVHHCGRPWRSSREVLNGIVWILRTGAQWVDLPEWYPPYQICHRRSQRWVRDGTLERVVEALAPRPESARKTGPVLEFHS